MGLASTPGNCVGIYILGERPAAFLPEPISIKIYKSQPLIKFPCPHIAFHNLEIGFRGPFVDG